MRAGEVPLQNLKDTLAALKAADHPNADLMEKRLKEVEKRRDAVKEAAEKRRKLLEDAHDLQELKRDAAELNNWVDEKAKAAEDDSFKDLGSLMEKGVLCPTLPLGSLLSRSPALDLSLVLVSPSMLRLVLKVMYFTSACIFI